VLEKLSDSLYLVRGPYNVLFSVFRDDVVIYETPLGAAYSRAVLDLVSSVAGGKRVRYAVASHFHPDHVVGVREYAARGITVLAPSDAAESIALLMRRPHTLPPDGVTAGAAAPAIEAVRHRKVLDRRGVRARLYDIGPTPHVAHLLVAYFPDEKLLFAADVFDVLTTDQVLAGADAAALWQRVRALGLDVEAFVPAHGAPIDRPAIERAFEFRRRHGL
jgi:glyoxylase-like metal-dependent hydrolase (beta-lactamase superfamily II)